MFILMKLSTFILKFLAVGVVGLFFLEDLELTRKIDTALYLAYASVGGITFFSLFFFVLGKKLLWLIVCLISGFTYFGMYHSVPDIAEIHEQNNIQNRYFKNTETFFSRMADVWKYINNSAPKDE